MWMFASFWFFCHQAHYIRAEALCCVGRREEALQEYFICVALKPDWTSAKAEAQKVSLYLLYHLPPSQCLFIKVLPSNRMPCCSELSISSQWVHGKEHQLASSYYSVISQMALGDEACLLRFQCSLKMFLTFCRCRSPQILSEMFSSIFQNDSLVTRLHPLQTTSSSPRIKPSSLLGSLHFPLTRDGARASCSKVRTHTPVHRSRTMTCSWAQKFVKVKIKKTSSKKWIGNTMKSRSECQRFVLFIDYKMTHRTFYPFVLRLKVVELHLSCTIAINIHSFTRMNAKLLPRCQEPWRQFCGRKLKWTAVTKHSYWRLLPKVPNKHLL